MTTNVFELTYRSGAKETVVTDAQTVEDQINRTFGMSPEEAAEFGVGVVLVGPYDAEQGAQEELHPSAILVDPQPEGATEQAAQPAAQTGEETQP